VRLYRQQKEATGAASSSESELTCIPMKHDSAPEDGMNQILVRNIRDLLAKRRKEQQRERPQQRLANAITRFAGSMACVWIHATVFGLWVIVNLGWTPAPRFDPTFVILATVASVEAIFLSTFVLISQNQMSTLSEKHAALDLQISLLAEHELTRLLQLARAIARKLDVAPPNELEFDELEKDVEPGNVLDTIDRESRAKHCDPRG
jgi:uncharacterized membrane protein